MHQSDRFFADGCRFFFTFVQKKEVKYCKKSNNKAVLPFFTVVYIFCSKIAIFLQKGEKKL